ncbi:hypothetical protein [Nocardioides montaniterrae]
MADYQVYGEPTTPEEGGDWQVVVEYSNGGQAKPPTIVHVERRIHVSRDDALEAARAIAFRFNPPDPWALQAREVYRDGADAFLVLLEGATATFPMSVRVVQPLPSRTAMPDDGAIV